MLASLAVLDACLGILPQRWPLAAPLLRPPVRVVRGVRPPPWRFVDPGAAGRAPRRRSPPRAYDDWAWIDPTGPWRWVDPDWRRPEPPAAPTIRALGYVPRNTVINGTGSTSSIAAAAINSTAGDTAWGMVSTENGVTLNSVTSSTGDSASILGPQSYASGAAQMWFWYAIGITGNASDVWTANFSAAASFGAICGTTTGGIGSYVTHTSNSSTGTVHTSGAINTSNAYAFLACADTLFNTGDYRANLGFIKATDGADHGACHYKIQDRTGSYSSQTTCTVSDAWAQFLVEFAPDGSGQRAVWPLGHSMSSATAPLTASTTSIAVPYVGGEEDGDYLLLHVVSKVSNAPGTPSGWTLINSSSENTGARAVDGGTVKHYLFGRECDGTESGTVTVSKTTETGTMIAGQMFRYKGKHAASNVWSIASATGNDTSTGTGVSVTFGSDPGISADDVVAIGFSDVSDVGANTGWIPNASLTATGCTFEAPGNGGTSTTNDGVASVWGTTQGDDARLAVLPYYVLTGPSSAAATWATTAASSAGNSHRGAAVLTRLRVSAAGKAPPPSLSPHPIFLLN